MAEENKRRQLIDVDEFEKKAREMAGVLGIDEHETRFSLADMIGNVRALVKPVNEWRPGNRPDSGDIRIYMVTYRLSSSDEIVFEAVYREEDGWREFDGEKIPPGRILAWQPLPDPYDIRICRHCKHHISNFLVGDFCTLSGTSTIVDHTCDDWEEKTREEAAPAEQEVDDGKCRS